MIQRVISIICLCALIAAIVIHINDARKIGILTQQILAGKSEEARQNREILRLKATSSQVAATSEPKTTDAAVRLRLPAVASTVNYEVMRNDPRYAPILHRTRLRDVERRYGLGIRQLHLSPESEDRLRELLASKLDAGTDARKLSQEQNLTTAETVAAVSRSTSEIESEIKAMIGPDGFATIESSDKLNAADMMVQREFGTDLVAKGVALTPPQQFAVDELYASSTDRLRFAPEDIDSETGLPRGWAGFLARLQTILTPPQYAQAQVSLAAQVKEIMYYRSLRGTQH